MTMPKVSSAKAKSARQHNATNSRLLTLPPEIRNKIYGYALGGKTIHTYDDKEGSLHSSFCLAKYNDEEYCRPNRLREQYTSYHSPRCAVTLENFLRHSSKNRIQLGLLETCSQVYNEAALILFYENAFSFHDDRDLGLLMAKLVPAQYESIRAICLPNAGSCDFEKYNVWAKLTSLRRLNIAVRIKNGTRNACARSTMNLSATELQTVKGRLAFEPLKRLNLDFFQFNLVATFLPLSSCPSWTDFNGLAADIENDVLKGWDEEALQAVREGRKDFTCPTGQLSQSESRGVPDSKFKVVPCAHKH